MGLVIGAAGLGNTIGIGLGSVLRKVTPSITVVVALVADAVAAVVAAVFYGLIPAVALGLTAGIAQAMGKLSLDALIQRDVPERHRTSAFARSETLLQLSWVIGGFIGIALPLKIGDTVRLGVLAGRVRRARPAVCWRRWRSELDAPCALSRLPCDQLSAVDDPRQTRQAPAYELGTRLSWSSSSASPRSSLAVGFAVLASGWRPAR